MQKYLQSSFEMHVMQKYLIFTEEYLHFVQVTVPIYQTLPSQKEKKYEKD